jgi:hypothetical protein
VIRNPLRCHVCDDVIGAYEPMIVQGEAAIRRTSRAAEPGLTRFGAAHYHEECYAQEAERGARSSAEQRDRAVAQ